MLKTGTLLFRTPSLSQVGGVPLRAPFVAEQSSEAQDRVLVPGVDVRRRGRDDGHGVVDAYNVARRIHLRIDPARVLVPGARRGPRASPVAAVAADIGLHAGAHARARPDLGVVRQVKVAAHEERRLRDCDVV